MDILTSAEAAQWLRLDEDDPVLEQLILVAYDIAAGAINDFSKKLQSAKFKRKLKLFMLNIIVNMYDSRGVAAGAEDKLQFVNATMLMQLQYGTYAEVDE